VSTSQPPPRPSPPPKEHVEEAWGEEQVPDTGRERLLELVVTVLLAWAALASAWAAYQATRFNGAQGDANTAASALRIESVKAESRANQLELVDTVAFQQWVSAVGTGNAKLAAFTEKRFREEFQPAFKAWFALDPLHDHDAPRTPFTMKEYKVSAQERANALAAEAEARTAEGSRRGSTGDRYVLGVVLFAAGLFLLGIQTRIGEFRLRLGLVAVAGILVVGTTAWLLTLPRLGEF
jgi:ferric-dicitrate binding protein FerR (iron transport regulator)